MWVIIFQTKLSKLIKFKKLLLLFFFVTSQFYKLYLATYSYFFHKSINMAPTSITCWSFFHFLKYFFLTLLSFLYILFSLSYLSFLSFHFILELISFIIFHFVLLNSFSFFTTFAPLKEPTKTNKILKQLNLWLV